MYGNADRHASRITTSSHIVNFVTSSITPLSNVHPACRILRKTIVITIPASDELKLKRAANSYFTVNGIRISKLKAILYIVSSLSLESNTCCGSSKLDIGFYHLLYLIL